LQWYADESINFQKKENLNPRRVLNPARVVVVFVQGDQGFEELKQLGLILAGF
jgi:hypothetical protein